jgi:hypothetical protein
MHENGKLYWGDEERIKRNEKIRKIFEKKEVK